MPTRPTVVLVHGAFADASGWAAVATQLSGDDVDVIAPPNHLRGVSADAAYVTSVLDQIEAGAIDGLSRRAEPTVDGLSLDVHAAFLELLGIAARAPRRSPARRLRV